MTTDTANVRLVIALNGVGTAHYDPRPAVVHFLTTKERRNGESGVAVYPHRAFAVKFFQQQKTIKT